MSRLPYNFRFVTTLRARPDEVWRHASSFAGVNRELWPLARMTYPRAMARLMPGAVPLLRTAFRSWILLLGIIPVDFDDMTLVETEDAREESSSLVRLAVEREIVRLLVGSHDLDVGRASAGLSFEFGSKRS